MIAVVPNMYDMVVMAGPSPRPVVDNEGDGRTFDCYSLPVDLRDSSYRNRLYAPYLRSGRRSFVQSMRVAGELDSRPHRSIKRHLSDISSEEDSDDSSRFMSSVVAITQSSTGQSYDVLPSRHEGSIPEEDFISSNRESILSAPPPVSFVDIPSHALRPRRISQADIVAQRGRQFSRNIGNPELRKRVQEKHQETRNRGADMLRSTAASEIRPESSSTPSFLRKIAMTNRITSPPSQTDTTAAPFPSSTAVTSQQTDATTITPTWHKSEVHSFHESLLHDPKTGDKKDSFFASFKTSAPNSSKTRSSQSVSPSSGETIEQTSLSRSAFPILKFFKRRHLFRKPGSSPSQQTLLPSQQSDSSLTDHYGGWNNSNGPQRGQNELECSCKSYHRHRFSGDVVNQDVEARKEKRQELIVASTRLESEQRTDSVDDPRNVFWIPALSFHPYRHGDPRVSFRSLWPALRKLRELLQNTGIQQAVVGSDAILDLCTLACTCGPTQLLKCLVELRLIRVDQVLENGSGLLHLALLAHNLESAQYLMAAKISPKIRDNKGLTADQVCFNPTVRKQVAPRYLLGRDVSRDRFLLMPSLHDKDAIFKLASNPKQFGEIQKKLQTLDFNVNTECDNNGDFLLHIAVRRGLIQLPLLMALVKIQGADIELCNADGMTPLMLAAEAGNCVLCDVLICLFGADPNKPNSQSGNSALHYAAEGNHRKTVECLIRRGADVNVEDHEGLRPDDVPACMAATDDCREIILFNRTKRLEMLSDLVRKGDIVSSQLLPSDLYVVDGDGNTLVMLAAVHNRFQTLHCLLKVSTATINAQHSQTGKTALSVAASLGNVEAVDILLRHKASAAIADMSSYLPLHYAVMNNHDDVVDVFLDYFPDTYISLNKAMRLCRKTLIHTKLRSAWERRQEEIVTPKLLGCTLNGDAAELFLLLEEGDNINPKSGTGNWPLYLAVENGHLEVVKLLFEKGDDIRKQHPTTRATVLHLAAKMGHQSIVSYLLQFCKQSQKKSLALPNSATGSGFQDKIPPMSKPSQGQVKSKRFLNINAVDGDNKTALQLAAEKGFNKIVEIFLSHGATTALLDAEGNLFTCPQFEGVRLKIESHREQHTRQIISCIEDKSRKGLLILQQIWLPRFDHHLRNREGSVPLMIAAQTGRIPIIEFLLESAVYPQFSNDESENNIDSDADSGVLDPTTPRALSKLEDDVDGSHEGPPFVFSTGTDLPETKTDYFNTRFVHNGTMTELHNQRLVSRIVVDAHRPKGMSIYNEGLVSHVCAVNLNDGSNVLHHAVRNSDAPHLLALFLKHDSTPLNMQNDKGETVFHTACRLGRKKCVEMMLTRPDLDLNICTLDGQLPEEVTSSRNIKKRIQKARAALTDVPDLISSKDGQVEPSLAGSVESLSLTESTINFDQIHTKYEALKQGHSS